VIVTTGTIQDCECGLALIAGFQAGFLLADRGYDSDELVQAAECANIQAHIPSRTMRHQPREYDRLAYKARHLVENAFLYLKRWRGIATRYAKNTASFLAAIQIRCIALWALKAASLL
jgi:transposase